MFHNEKKMKAHEFILFKENLKNMQSIVKQNRKNQVRSMDVRPRN